jgi:uncharacterized protein YoaH (UPF0181 family)
MDVFEHLELEARDTDARETTLAIVRATVRARKQFGSLVRTAGSLDTFKSMLALTGGDFDAMIVAACDEEDSDNYEFVKAQVANKLALDAGLSEMPFPTDEPMAIDSQGEDQVMPMPDGQTMDALIKMHGEGTPEAEEGLARMYDVLHGTHTEANPDLPHPEPQFAHASYDYGSAMLYMASDDEDKKDDDDDKDADKSKSKHRHCPTCKAQPGDDCKNMSPDDDVDGDDTHEARKKGEGEGSVPVVHLHGSVMEGFRAFVAAEGAGADDSYHQESVELPSSTEGVSADPSPKMDEGSSGDLNWTLPPIEVPSNLHPTEQQAVSQTPDYEAEPKFISDTGKQISVDTPIGSEETGPATDVFPNKNQADPVTTDAILSMLNKTAWGDDFGMQDSMMQDHYDQHRQEGSDQGELLRAVAEGRMSPEDYQRLTGKPYQAVPGQSPLPQQQPGFAQPVTGGVKQSWNPDIDDYSDDPIGAPQARGWAPDDGPAGLSTKLQQAMRELVAQGMSQEAALHFINKFLDERHDDQNAARSDVEGDPYGMSQGLDQEDMQSMHTVGKSRWTVLD